MPAMPVPMMPMRNGAPRALTFSTKLAALSPDAPAGQGEQPMATYSTEIDAPEGQDEVFEYMATFSNAREWDPGVAEAESLTPGPGARSGRCTGSACGSPAGSCRSTTGSSRSTGPAGSSSRPRTGTSCRRTPSRWRRPDSGSRVRYVAVLEGRGLLRLASPLVGQCLRRPWRTGRPPGSAPRWHDPVAPSLRRRGRGARGDVSSGSFSRAGYAVRSRLEHWRPPPDLTGRVVVVTGASSGIGQAAALELARLGRHLWLVGRDRGGSRRPPARPAHLGAGAAVEPVVLDIVDADAVQAFADRGRRPATTGCTRWSMPPARSSPRTARALGGELTVATAVAGALRPDVVAQPAAAPSRGRHHRDGVVGRHVLPALRPRPPRNAPRGLPRHHRLRAGEAGPGRAVARVGPPLGRRRCGQLRRRTRAGWTRPGLASGLPTFAKLGPLLRTPAEGADTVVWLAAGGPGIRPGPTTEGFFHDRHRRSEHHLPWTARGAGRGRRRCGSGASPRVSGRPPLRQRARIGFTVVTLDHLILTVNDREASVRFYTEVMGFGDEGEDGPFSVRVSPTRRCSWRPGAPRAATTWPSRSPEEFEAAFDGQGGRGPLRRLVPRRRQHAGPGDEAGPRAWPHRLPLRPQRHLIELRHY